MFLIFRTTKTPTEIICFVNLTVIQLDLYESLFPQKLERNRKILHFDHIKQSRVEMKDNNG